MRRHGEGSLWVERRKGRPTRWVVQWSLPGGRRIKRRYRDEDAALEALKRIAPVRVASSMTLGDYLAAWLHRVRPTISTVTWDGYEQVCRMWLVPNLGTIRLDRLSVADVRGYLHSLPLHPRTVAHHRAVLRKALNDARADHLVPDNPAAMAKPPTVPRHERRWLAPDELRVLFDTTKGDPMHAMWVLAGTMGLRNSELRALAWDDVDLDERQLLVRHTLHRLDGEWVFRETKTRQTRTVPIGARAHAALVEHRRRQLELSLEAGLGSYPLVFTTPNGRPFHKEDLAGHLRIALEAAGLPVVNLHDLRHAAASAWVASGVDIVTVSRLLGHTTPAITMSLYIHVGEGLKRDAVQRLDEVLG